MKKNNSNLGGFSLVEVVISIAVVALALVSILGLLAVFLKGSNDAVNRQEAQEVYQPLNSYLQNQGFSKVYTWLQVGGVVPQIYAFNVPVDQNSSDSSSYGLPITTAPPTGQSPGTPEVFVLSQADTGAPTGTANFANFTNGSYLTNCSGRIYYISISVSANVPIHLGVAQTPTYLPIDAKTGTTDGIPASSAATPSGSTDGTFFADAAIPISVRVYAVPPPPFTVSSAINLEKQNFIYPILSYDTTVSR